MDGSEVMSLTGSSLYHLNRGEISGPGSLSVSLAGGSGIPTETSYRPFSNPSIPIQSNVGGGIHGDITFQVENPSQSFSYGISKSIHPSVPPGDQVKKKRGRPRKYGPNGANMSLGLSPMSSASSIGSLKVRGRPRGSGWKQRLAPLGEWMNNTAGIAFMPHVLHVGVGEDVAAKVISFAQQRPRALCIMSASGAVSLVTLRQPTNSGGTVSFEGRFKILCLSGSYLVSETGGPSNRDGGLSISVCSSPDGQCIGGALGGKLIASSPVQVVVCSFVYGSKALEKKETSGGKAEKSSTSASVDDKSSIPVIAVPFQNAAPHSSTAMWPPVIRPELRYPHTKLELKRE